MNRGRSSGVRVGVAHNFGWAVAVTASPDHEVVDRRRLELIEPGLPSAPVHHVGGPHDMHRQTPPLDDDALAALVADVRESVLRASSAALDGRQPKMRRRLGESPGAVAPCGPLIVTDAMAGCVPRLRVRGRSVASSRASVRCTNATPTWP